MTLTGWAGYASSRLLKARPGSSCCGCWQAPRDFHARNQAQTEPSQTHRSSPASPGSAAGNPRTGSASPGTHKQHVRCVFACGACFCSSLIRKSPSYWHAASWGSLFFLDDACPNSQRKGSKAVQGTAHSTWEFAGKATRQAG